MLCCNHSTPLQVTSAHAHELAELEQRMREEASQALEVERQAHAATKASLARLRAKAQSTMTALTSSNHGSRSNSPVGTSASASLSAAVRSPSLADLAGSGGDDLISGGFGIVSPHSDDARSDSDGIVTDGHYLGDRDGRTGRYGSPSGGFSSPSFDSPSSPSSPAAASSGAGPRANSAAYTSAGQHPSAPSSTAAHAGDAQAGHGHGGHNSALTAPRAGARPSIPTGAKSGMRSRWAAMSSASSTSEPMHETDAVSHTNSATASVAENARASGRNSNGSSGITSTNNNNGGGGPIELEPDDIEGGDAGSDHGSGSGYGRASAGAASSLATAAQRQQMHSASGAHLAGGRPPDSDRSMDGIQQQIDGLLSQLAEETGKVTQLTTERDALRAQLVAVSAEKDEIKCSRDALSNANVDLRQQIADTAAIVDKLKAEINASNATVAQLESTLQQKDSSLQAAASTATVLQQQIEVLKLEVRRGDIDRVQAESLRHQLSLAVVALCTDVAAGHVPIDTTSSFVRALESSVAAAEATVAAVSEGIAQQLAAVAAAGVDVRPLISRPEGTDVEAPTSAAALQSSMLSATEGGEHQTLPSYPQVLTLIKQLYRLASEVEVAPALVPVPPSSTTQMAPEANPPSSSASSHVENERSAVPVLSQPPAPHAAADAGAAVAAAAADSVATAGEVKDDGDDRFSDSDNEEEEGDDADADADGDGAVGAATVGDNAAAPAAASPAPGAPPMPAASTAESALGIVKALLEALHARAAASAASDHHLNTTVDVLSQTLRSEAPAAEVTYNDSSLHHSTVSQAAAGGNFLNSSSASFAQHDQGDASWPALPSPRPVDFAGLYARTSNKRYAGLLMLLQSAASGSSMVSSASPTSADDQAGSTAHFAASRALLSFLAVLASHSSTVDKADAGAQASPDASAVPACIGLMSRALDELQQRLMAPTVPVGRGGASTTIEASDSNAGSAPSTSNSSSADDADLLESLMGTVNSMRDSAMQAERRHAAALAEVALVRESAGHAVSEVEALIRDRDAQAEVARSSLIEAGERVDALLPQANAAADAVTSLAHTIEAFRSAWFEDRSVFAAAKQEWNGTLAALANQLSALESELSMLAALETSRAPFMMAAAALGSSTVGSQLGAPTTNAALASSRGQAEARGANAASSSSVPLLPMSPFPAMPATPSSSASAGPWRARDGEGGHGNEEALMSPIPNHPHLHQHPASSTANSASLSSEFNAMMMSPTTAAGGGAAVTMPPTPTTFKRGLSSARSNNGIDAGAASGQGDPFDMFTASSLLPAPSGPGAAFNSFASASLSNRASSGVLRRNPSLSMQSLQAQVQAGAPTGSTQARPATTPRAAGSTVGAPDNNTAGNNIDSSIGHPEDVASSIQQSSIDIRARSELAAAIHGQSSTSSTTASSAEAQAGISSARDAIATARSISGGSSTNTRYSSVPGNVIAGAVSVISARGSPRIPPSLTGSFGSSGSSTNANSASGGIKMSSPPPLAPLSMLMGMGLSSGRGQGIAMVLPGPSSASASDGDASGATGISGSGRTPLRAPPVVPCGSFATAAAAGASSSSAAGPYASPPPQQQPHFNRFAAGVGTQLEYGSMGDGLSAQIVALSRASRGT